MEKKDDDSFSCRGGQTESVKLAAIPKYLHRDGMVVNQKKDLFPILKLLGWKMAVAMSRSP
jgi:hypothetical protein